jgi:hypothetical protein
MSTQDDFRVRPDSSSPKRNKRREKREAEFGPDRAIIETFTDDGRPVDRLECGHTVSVPETTVRNVPAKWRRCLACRAI